MIKIQRKIYINKAVINLKVYKLEKKTKLRNYRILLIRQVILIVFSYALKTEQVEKMFKNN